MYFHLGRWFLLPKYICSYKNRLWSWVYFVACGFANVKLAIVDLRGGVGCGIVSLRLLPCKIWISLTLVASESYYHPIRECGILVILLLFPVGSDYNEGGQGLMQFISFNTGNSESLITQCGFVGVPLPLPSARPPIFSVTFAAQYISLCLSPPEECGEGRNVVSLGFKQNIN